MTATRPVVQHLARLALYARALEFSAVPITLGSITLLAHQTAAVRWLLHRIDRHGGALLADPPGLGKTYVALAVAAARSARPLVIAPATLRARWHDAARETGIALDFISTERLSAPAPPHVPPATLVIIDEAHHLRTPSTRRHQRTSALCTHADVLLLSATPIHNHTRDLEHIAALFHLPPAHASATLLRRRLTLRRTLAEIQSAGGSVASHHAIPAIHIRRDFAFTPNDTPVPAAMVALPKLAADTPESHRLVQLGIIHALRSSNAAALERIRRRIAVTLAIEHAACARVQPTAELKRAFQSQHGDVQLAMAALLALPDTGSDPRIIHTARDQRVALEALVPHLMRASDSARAAVLRRLARWTTAPVVAFTQFHATAESFYRQLRHQPGIAWLGGASAHITSGVIPRDELLDRLLSPRYRAWHDGVRLLITTDVLSEGLSLAGVATIVHLDLPWTAARIDQRIGRAARIGAPVAAVSVVTLPAPLPAAMHAAVRSLISTKRERMSVLADAPDEDVAIINVLRRLCEAPVHSGRAERWITLASPLVHTPLIVADVRVEGKRMLVASDARVLRRPTSRDWRVVASGIPIAMRRGDVAELRRRLRASVVERELTVIVSDPRDRRLQLRRGADDALLSGDWRSRGSRALDATDARRMLMHAVRRIASPHLVDAGPTPAQCATPRAEYGRRSNYAVLILAGVTIVPQS